MSEYFSAAECSETFERLRDVALNGGIRVLTQKDCAIAATEIGRLHDRIAALEADLARARAAVDSACRRMFEAQTDRLSFEVRMAGALKERDEARAECEKVRNAVAIAYGHLWHVNNEPMAPIPMYSPEKAAYAARKELRDLLTSEQRGDAINATQHVWGDAARKEGT